MSNRPDGKLGVVLKFMGAIMPYRYIEFQAGEFYHIYHRGANKQKIFFEADNYLYFSRLLRRQRDRYAMNIIAYCLMPNHFHLMLQPQRRMNLSQFMGKLQQSYVQAINWRYRRTGPLFRERFRHVHVHGERHQLLLCRYIHVNPKKDGLVRDLRDWPSSNYLEFIGARHGGLVVPGYREKFFATGKEYEEFVAAYGADDDNELERILAGSK